MITWFKWIVVILLRSITQFFPRLLPLSFRFREFIWLFFLSASSFVDFQLVSWFWRDWDAFFDWKTSSLHASVVTLQQTRIWRRPSRHNFALPGIFECSNQEPVPRWIPANLIRRSKGRVFGDQPNILQMGRDFRRVKWTIRHNLGLNFSFCKRYLRS